MSPTIGNGKTCHLEIPTVEVARSVRSYQAVLAGAPGDAATGQQHSITA